MSINAKEAAALIQVLAWPVMTGILVFCFRTQLSRLLVELGKALGRAKSIKLKAFRTEVELTPEQAKSALDELLGEILQTTNELTPD